MTITIRASAEAFQVCIPGELVGQVQTESADDVFVQILVRQPNQGNIMIPAVPEPLIVWIVSGEAEVFERPLGGEWLSNEVIAGDFFLTTARAPTEMRWKAHGTEPFRVMHVYIGVQLLQRAIRGALGRVDRDFALREVSGESDAVLSSLLGHINQEMLSREAPSSAFIRGLAQAMTVHVVRTYETGDPQQRRPRGGLQAYKLNRIFDVMTERLHEPFRLADYARIAALSAFHFSRVFKESTGKSPSNYFIDLRIERAKALLVAGERSVIDVSLAVGYASPSHFSRVFRAGTGVTPKEYRNGNR